jgi:ketosteroid isomerase-like protein
VSEELAAEAEIRRVVGLFARGCDRDDMALVRSCYFEDATEDRGRYVGGVDGFIEWLEAMRAGFESTWHQIGEPLIELDGDSAAVETYCMVAQRPLGGPTRLIPTRYLDRFERRDGRWRIAARKAVYEGAFPLDQEAM